MIQNSLPTIESLLNKAHSTLVEFLTAIHAERQCLKGDVSTTLQDVTARKADLATRLAELDTQRDIALRAKGLAAGRKGIEAWLETLPRETRGESRAAWLSILERAAEAKRENELNGKLISVRLQQNHQALGVLLGETGEASTYGADGQRNTRAGRRTLGSA